MFHKCNQMKLTKLIKLSFILMTILLGIVSLMACGSDNEPDKHGNIENVDDFWGTIDLDVFSGSWLIKDFTIQNTGEVLSINKEIIIKTFSVKQTLPCFSDGTYDMWGETYDSLITTNGTTGEEDDDCTVLFYKIKGQPLSSSKVFSFTFTVSDKNWTYLAFSAQNLFYNNGILLCKSCTYGKMVLDSENPTSNFYDGILKLEKLQ